MNFNAPFLKSFLVSPSLPSRLIKKVSLQGNFLRVFKKSKSLWLGNQCFCGKYFAINFHYSQEYRLFGSCFSSEKRKLFPLWIINLSIFLLFAELGWIIFRKKHNFPYEVLLRQSSQTIHALKKCTQENSQLLQSEDFSFRAGTAKSFLVFWSNFQAVFQVVFVDDFNILRKHCCRLKMFQWLVKNYSFSLVVERFICSNCLCFWVHLMLRVHVGIVNILAKDLTKLDKSFCTFTIEFKFSVSSTSFFYVNLFMYFYDLIFGLF